MQLMGTTENSPNHSEHRLEIECGEKCYTWEITVIKQALNLQRIRGVNADV